MRLEVRLDGIVLAWYALGHAVLDPYYHMAERWREGREERRSGGRKEQRGHK